ncbi:MAG: helix-turn-helix domain-containing protein [Candidatus Limnocylindria bacterium]
MNRLTNSKGRVYRSKLREEQAEATRTRILEATMRVMASGLASLSIPAVAREAGVSVPTIYRHFGSKNDLLGATYPYVIQRAGSPAFVAPDTIDELRERVRSLFAGLDRIGEFGRAAMSSPAAEDARRLSIPRRLALSRQLADSVVPRLAARDRARIARLLTILMTSSAFRWWREYLGSSVDEAADDLDWIVRAAIAASETEDA